MDHRRSSEIMGLLSSPLSYVPDLSHLTEDEKRIIQDVMIRHKMEEDKEAEILKKTQEEVMSLESAIRERSEEQRKRGIELEATCRICLKSKFADGVGHLCNYCGVRCCASCGGKVSLRSNKMIWVCILCRKKQEFLIKTGQWIHSSMASRLRQLEAETPLTTPTRLEFDKRMRLERAFSLEKEGHPRGPSVHQAPSSSSAFPADRRGSLGLPPTHTLDTSASRSGLRRQWSQETSLPPHSHHPASAWSEPLRRLSLSQMRMMEPRSTSPSLLQQHQQQRSSFMNRLEQMSGSRPNLLRPPTDLSDYPQGESGIGSETGTVHKMHRQSSSEIPRIGNIGWSSLESGTGTAVGSGFESGGSSRRLPRQHLTYPTTHHPLFPPTSVHHTPPLHHPPHHHQQHPSVHGVIGPDIPSDILVPSELLERSQVPPPPAPSSGYQMDYASKRQLLSSSGGRHSLDQGVAAMMHAAAASRRRESFMRGESLSSEHSANIPLDPSISRSVTSHSRPRMRRERFQHQFSLSSSEEDLRSGPLPPFAIPPGGMHEPSSLHHHHPLDPSDPHHHPSSSSPFDQSIKCQKSLKRQEDILDAKIKRFLAHPITWKPSSDGTKLIGHMILKKSEEPSGAGSSAALLGLKVVGGRITGGGAVGAVIEKVKKGSIADTVGRLRPGDEVLEWNGRSLQGLTYEEAYDIMAESKQESQVELIVCRYIRRLPLPSPIPPMGSSASNPIQESYDPRHKTLLRRHTDVNIQVPPITKHDLGILRQQSLGSQMPRSRVRVSRSSTISGRIQIKLWYDIQSLQLVVTVLGAVELPPRSSGQPRNPFAKIVLLPDRSEKSKRRTKTIPATNDPKWDQTFVYSPLRRSDLKTRALEIALWDYDRFGCSEFLGEVLIELATAPLDDEGEWYLLGTHEETITQLRLQQKLYLLPSDRLSPPSTISRLSDSDISEIDLIEYGQEFALNTSRESWRGLLADTSQSSFGSSSSPPVFHPGDEYRRRTFGKGIDYHPLLHHHMQRSLESPIHRGRGHRPPLFGEGIMATSLPSHYEGPDYPRPSFRKSSSQPTRRSVSPALSLRSPTEPHPLPPAHSHVTWMSQSSMGAFMKKRHLPQAPPTRRLSRDQSAIEAEAHQMWTRRPQFHHRTSSGDAMTPQGMYSDSEITSRPYSADRLFYAHPTHRAASSTHHMRRGRSLARYSPELERETERELERERERRLIQDEERQERERERQERTRSEEAEDDQQSSSQQRPPRRVLAEAVAGDEGSETSSKISVTEASALTTQTPARGSRSTAREGALERKPGIRVQRSLEEESRSGGDRGDGSLSDTAIGQKSMSEEKLEEISSDAGGSGERGEDPSIKGKKGVKGDLNKLKSSSTSQLSGAGAKKRLGFRKKTITSFSVHRSEEVAPDEVRHLVKQASSASDGEGSISGESASTWVPAMRLQAEGEVSNFVEGLGPGQLVGRQALAAVNYGDIQLSICDRKGNIEVEVIRARNLMTKLGARMLPATYVKVYMMKQRKCLAKARTALARRTLDPLYQQQLVFNQDYKETILQITVWGDYGRLDKKTFMGMAQVCLDDLDLSNIVIGWYKLLPPTSATLTNLAPTTALQEAKEAKLAAMAANMRFFGE